MATDAEYTAAAQAVAAGTAKPDQVALNNKMANNPRLFSPLVQQAQDAQAAAKK